MKNCCFKYGIDCEALTTKNCKECWAKCTSLKDLDKRYKGIFEYNKECNNYKPTTEYKRFKKRLTY